MADRKQQEFYQAMWVNNLNRIAVLIDEGINVNKEYISASLPPIAPLYGAAASGAIDLVRLLLAAPGINVNQLHDLGSTPVGVAAAHRHIEVVRLLLASPGIDVNLGTTTPLNIAVATQDIETVRLLLAAPEIDVNKANYGQGETALYIACNLGNLAIVNLLLASPDIDVNKSSKINLFDDDNNNNIDNVTPLHVAVFNGHADIVERLLDVKGIDLLKECCGGQTAKDIAIDIGYDDELIASLIKQEAWQRRRHAIVAVAKAKENENQNGGKRKTKTRRNRRKIKSKKVKRN